MLVGCDPTLLAGRDRFEVGGDDVASVCGVFGVLGRLRRSTAAMVLACLDETEEGCQFAMTGATVSELVVVMSA